MPDIYSTRQVRYRRRRGRRRAVSWASSRELSQVGAGGSLPGGRLNAWGACCWLDGGGFGRARFATGKIFNRSFRRLKWHCSTSGLPLPNKEEPPHLGGGSSAARAQRWSATASAVILILSIVLQAANANKNHSPLLAGQQLEEAAAAAAHAEPASRQSQKAFHHQASSNSPPTGPLWPLLGVEASEGEAANASQIYVKVGALLEESDHEQANMFIRTIQMINERREETIRQLLNLSASISSRLDPATAEEFAASGKLPVVVKLEPMIEFLASRDDSLEADSKVCQLIGSGCNVIVGPKDGASIQHVQSICDNIEIPYFELRPFLGSTPQIISSSSTASASSSASGSQEGSSSAGEDDFLVGSSASGNQESSLQASPMEHDKGNSLAANSLGGNQRQNSWSVHNNAHAAFASGNKLEELTLNLYPPANLLTSAYIDLIYAWNWTSFAIVYEEGSSMIKLQDLFRESSGTWTSKWKIKLFQFQQQPQSQKPSKEAAATSAGEKKLASEEQPSAGRGSSEQPGQPATGNSRDETDNNHDQWKTKSKASFRSIFWQIKSIEETNIILDVKTEHLFEALKNAQQVGCMTERYSYLITSLDLHTIELEDFKYSRTRLTAFNLLQVNREPADNKKAVHFHESYLERLGVHVIKSSGGNGAPDKASSREAKKAAEEKQQAASNIRWSAQNKYKLSPSVVLDKAGAFLEPPSELFQRDWAQRDQLTSSPESMGLLPSLDRDSEQRLFEFFVGQQERENLAPKLRLSTASAIMHDSLVLYMLGLNELDPTGSFLRSYLNYGSSSGSFKGDQQGKQFVSCSPDSVPWLHGSSLVNYMRRITFTGLTGSVSFDQAGLRSDFKLDVMGMAPELGLVKVGEWHSRHWGSPEAGADPYRTSEGERKPYDELSAVYEEELKRYSELLARGQPFRLSYKRLLASGATRAGGPGRGWLHSGPGGTPSGALLVNDIIYERLYRDQTDQVDTLIVTTKISHPYFMLKETPNKLEGNDQYEGFVVDLIHELSKLVNFKYRWREAADKKYGSKTPGANGTFVWNGMIGEIVRGVADLAIVDLTITSQREEAVDFTLPFMNTGISILFKKPTTKVTTLFSFLSPFSSDVWAYVLAAYCGISAILFFVGHLSPYEWADPNPCRHSALQQQQQSFSFDNDDDDDHNLLAENPHQSQVLAEPILPNLKNQFSLLNSFWFTIGSLMQQGSDLTPRSMSTRTIASIWYFFTLIMISSYTANLAAFLTVEKVVYPIENVRDLSQQSEIRYGCVESGSTCTFFSDSQIDTYKKINEGMRNHKTFIRSNDEGQKRVEEGKFAFFMESASIEYIIERNCNLTQIGGLLDSKGYGLATSKKSRLRRPYRTLLSEGILHLQETGMLHTLKNRWWKERRGGGTCTDDGKGGGVTELSLANVGGVFVVLLGGLGLSFLVAIAEFMWRSRRSGSTRDRMCEEMMSDLKFALACKHSTKPVKESDLKRDRKLGLTTKGVRRQLARQQSSLVSQQSSSTGNANGQPALIRNWQQVADELDQRQANKWEPPFERAKDQPFNADNHRRQRKQQHQTNRKLDDKRKLQTISDPALIGTRQAVGRYGKDCDPILLHAMLTMLMQQEAPRLPQQEGNPIAPSNADQPTWSSLGREEEGRVEETEGERAAAAAAAPKRRHNLLLAQQRIELADSPESSNNNINGNSWRRKTANNNNN